MAPWLFFLFLGFVMCENITEVTHDEKEERHETTTTISPQEADDYFADSLLEELKIQANLSDVEPIPVGDVSFLTGGHFKGLTTIRRDGHTHRQGNDTLVIPAVLENTETTFNWTFSFLFTKSKGGAIVRSTHMPISLHVHTGPERLAHLEICDVPHMKGLTVQITGAGNLNFLTSRVAAIALGLTRSSLTRQLQDPVCAFVAGVL